MAGFCLGSGCVTSPLVRRRWCWDLGLLVSFCSSPMPAGPLAIVMMAIVLASHPECVSGLSPGPRSRASVVSRFADQVSVLLISLADFICGTFIIHYISNLIVECHREGAFIFVRWPSIPGCALFVPRRRLDMDDHNLELRFERRYPNRRGTNMECLFRRVNGVYANSIVLSPSWVVRSMSSESILVSRG